MNINEQIVNSNVGQLMGKVVSGPVKTHTVFEENFYEVMLEVKRLSDKCDYIPVSFGERMISNFDDISEGKTIAVTGEFRSYNKLVENKSKLILYFFAKGFLPEEEKNALNIENSNLLTLKGFICKPPVFRETPFGRQICDLLLAVNRATFNRSDYIPCLAWGRNAFFAKQWGVGTSVEINGRIQSRPYKKTTDQGEEEHVAYEVSCKSIAVIENAGSNKNNQVEPNQILQSQLEG